MLDGISEGVRAFTDEVRIQLLAVENPLSENIPSTLVSLRDLRAISGGRCAGRRRREISTEWGQGVAIDQRSGSQLSWGLTGKGAIFRSRVLESSPARDCF
jgi:hypothetical protein